MAIFHWIVIISWLAFIGYWAVSAVGTKRDATKSAWRSGWAYAVRLAIAAMLVLLATVRLPGINRFSANNADTLGSAAAQVGAVVCALGIAFAIWARFHLGKNWSSYPTVKEDHDLITSGPYRFVRHPIYTGVLLAELGTGLAFGYIWFIPLVFGAVVFMRRIPIEERIMTKQFPDQYPEYKKHTNALIPFVW